MQFATTFIFASAFGGGAAATCNVVAISALSGTACFTSQVSGGAWYEKTSECGSSATIIFEDARGGSNPVAASMVVENTSSSLTRVFWSEVSYASTNIYYVDLAAGASCDRTLNTGFNIGSVAYD